MSLDLTGVASGLKNYGGQAIRKKVSEWDLQNDVFIHRNITAPVGLPKISAGGNPRPYAKAENMQDTLITDQTLTVRQSKWDFDLDYEALRNTYLSAVSNGKLDPNNVTIHQYIVDQFATEYMAQLYDNTVGAGTYNGSGTTAAAIADGYLTLIAAAISATTLTPIVTGAITTSNAVSKVEIVCKALPFWMLQRGFKILCSFDLFTKYKEHYRTLNPFGLQTRNDLFQLDGFKGTLEPRGWLGTSQRLIAVPVVASGDFKNVLHMGTDDGKIAIYPTISLNIIKIRMLFPVGFQISDLGGIFVNDQA